MQAKMALRIWWHITPKKLSQKHQTINLARKTKTTQKQFPFHRSNPKTKPFIQVNITIIALTAKRQRWLLSRTKKEENCFFLTPIFHLCIAGALSSDGGGYGKPIFPFWSHAWYPIWNCIKSHSACLRQVSSAWHFRAASTQTATNLDERTCLSLSASSILTSILYRTLTGYMFTNLCLTVLFLCFRFENKPKPYVTEPRKKCALKINISQKSFKRKTFAITRKTICTLPDRV